MSASLRPSENGTSSARAPGFFTIPNVLCVIRIVGSFVLVPLAFYQQAVWFIGLYFFLALTDWVDGKLARYFNQQTDIGAKLDSAADSILYLALVIGGVILLGETLLEQAAWFAVAMTSYAIHIGYGFWKFGQKPVYHTLGAKLCWFLVTVSALCILGDIAVWPFQVTMVIVTFANIETILITAALKQWQADVPSLYHVLGENGSGTEESSRAGVPETGSTGPV